MALSRVRGDRCGSQFCRKSDNLRTGKDRILCTPKEPHASRQKRGARRQHPMPQIGRMRASQARIGYHDFFPPRGDDLPCALVQQRVAVHGTAKKHHAVIFMPNGGAPQGTRAPCCLQQIPCNTPPGFTPATAFDSGGKRRDLYIAGKVPCGAQHNRASRGKTQKTDRFARVACHQIGNLSSGVINTQRRRKCTSV